MVLHYNNQVLGILFLSQIGVGILGNSTILCFFSFALFTSHRLRPMDPILIQHSLTNIMVLLSQGCPLVILHFRKRYFLGDTGCKIIFYVQRISQGVTISTTSLLVFFQAVTISPSNSRLAKLKGRAPKFISPSCLLCWIINMIVEINVPISVTGLKSSSSNNNNSQKGIIFLLFCSKKSVNTEVVTLPSLRDILFVGCMVWASGYTGLFLLRHHQRVKHIHSTSLSPRTSPEIKATQTILLMVGIFVSAYCVSCGFTLYKVYVIHSGSWVMIVSTLTALCFPTFSPFVLIHRDTHISKSCYDSWQRTFPFSVVF